MNVIYILSDQHRFDMLSCAGDPVVKTPNIDRLAREGLRFSNAFTPSSICTPARASVFTGLFPASHGMTGNEEHAAKTGCDMAKYAAAPKLADCLSDCDKYLFGKWHVEGQRLPADYGFKGHNFSGYGYPGSRLYKNLKFMQPPAENRYARWLAEKGFEIPEVTEAFFGDNPNLQVQELAGRLSGPPEATIERFIVDEAIQTLRARDSDKPFFLWMNFWGPHTPCVTPEPYCSMYAPETIPEPAGFDRAFEGKPLHHKRISQMWGLHGLDWSGWQRILARYYGHIALIDDCIGIFLKHLQEAGLYDNSLIVFCSDHGDDMGAHRLIEKGEFMYDSTYRIPFIARHPDCERQGTVSEEFVYLHDLFPTAVETLTGKIPDTRGESQSLLGLFKGRSQPTGRTQVFGEFNGHFCAFPQRMVRTRTHKLVFNGPDMGELYEFASDPWELRNQINNPSFNAVKKDLLDRLGEWMRGRGDPLFEWFQRIRDSY